jgi:hypothetical protein
VLLVAGVVIAPKRVRGIVVHWQVGSEPLGSGRCAAVGW